MSVTRKFNALKFTAIIFLVVFFSTVLLAQGHFASAVNYPVGTFPNAIAVADFNHDGKPDLVVANGKSASISVLLGNGDGTFQPAVNYGVASGPLSVAVGDFNGDGKVDIAVDGSSGVDILFGNGDGTFQPPVTIQVPGGPSDRVAVGDFNKDGKLDLVAISNGMAYVFLGKGDGTFLPPVGYQAGAFTENIVVGDFNGDGNPDLAVASQFAPPGAMVSILLGNGDGTFKPQVVYVVGANFSFLVAGDFNQDGKLDLAMTDFYSTVKIWMGNGDGTFQGVCCLGPQNRFPAGPYPEGITIGDFNLDGKTDIAVTNQWNNFVSVLLGNNDGTFTMEPLGLYTVGSQPIPIVTADFNGDGKPDLAVGNTAENSISVLINTAKIPTSTTLVSSSNPAKLHADVTFTATVSSNKGAPSGTISLIGDGKTLGTGIISAGMVSFTTSALSAGKHSMTAVYSGDSDFAGSSSPILVQTIQPHPDFTITASPNTATVKAGQMATILLTVTPTDGFNSPIDFSCSGLPASINCNFMPSRITPNGGPVVSILQINTMGTGVAQLQNPSAPLRPWSLSASMYGISSLGLVGIVLAGGSRKKFGAARRVAVFAVLLLGMLVLMTGCGGNLLNSAANSPLNLTPALGSNQVVVTAQAGAGTSQQMTVTVVVTQ